MRSKLILALTIASLALASPTSSPAPDFRTLAEEFERSSGMADWNAWAFRNDGPAAAYFRGFADAYAQAAARLRAEVEKAEPAP